MAIHLILYVREIYPSGIFQKRKKYNVPVQVMFLRLMTVQWEKGNTENVAEGI